MPTSYEDLSVVIWHREQQFLARLPWRAFQTWCFGVWMGNGSPQVRDHNTDMGEQDGVAGLLVPVLSPALFQLSSQWHLLQICICHVQWKAMTHPPPFNFGCPTTRNCNLFVPCLQVSLRMIPFYCHPTLPL